MPTNAINDTGVKYLYDKLHGEIEPVAEAVSDREVTIEGNPLNFNTLSSQNAKSTILSLEPIQDLHGYDKPWVGGAGKNKINTLDREITNTDSLTTIRAENCTAVKNGDIFNCTCSSSGGYAKLRVLLDTSKLENGKTYTFSAKFDNPNSNYVGVGYVPNVQGSWIATASSAGGYKSISFVFDSSWTTILFGLLLNNSGTPNTNIVYVSEIQLEEASTKSDYEPYENICPISGRSEIGILGCGKNLVNSKNANSGLLSITVGDSINDISASTRYSYSNPILAKTGLTVSFSSTDLTKFNWLTVNMYVDDILVARTITTIPNINTLYTVNVPSNTYDKICLVYGAPANEAVGTNISGNIQVEEGSAATEYESFIESNDLTISLGQTVYGGTLDVENGVLVVDRSIYTATGQENFAYYGASSTVPARFAVSLSSIGISVDTALYNTAISSKYKAGNLQSDDTSKLSLQSNYLTIVDTRYDGSTLADFKSDINGLQIVYPLATPITIQLTPHTINLLKGVNNISTDGDKITLTYRDGSVATLGDLTSAVDELDGKIDESKILTDTATGDKYILVVTNGVLSVEQISN